MREYFLIHKDNETPVGNLYYTRESDTYELEITAPTPYMELPAIIKLLLMKGVRYDNGKIARRFVETRVVPPERQNIGMILRSAGLTTYDPIEIMKQTNGQFCIDSFSCTYVGECE